MESRVWFCSIRCLAYLDEWLLFLKAFMCSWNRIVKFLPVCPTYSFLQSGHVSLYTPDRVYLSVVWVLRVSALRMVFTVRMRFLGRFFWTYWWWRLSLFPRMWMWPICVLLLVCSTGVSLDWGCVVLAGGSGRSCCAWCSGWCSPLVCIRLLVGRMCLVYCRGISQRRICVGWGGLMCMGWWCL